MINFVASAEPEIDQKSVDLFIFEIAKPNKLNRTENVQFRIECEFWRMMLVYVKGHYVVI